MSVVHDLTRDLDLGVGDDTKNINRVFNDWRADNKSHIFTAAVTWPQPIDDDFGIILISNFVKGRENGEHRSYHFSGYHLQTRICQTNIGRDAGIL